MATKPAKRIEFDIGLGIRCELKVTEDKKAVLINMKGIFRHGGLSLHEIMNRLTRCIATIDIDM